MKNVFLISCLISVNSFISAAQDSTGKKINRIKLAEYYFNTGISYEYSTALGIPELREMAPGSSLLNKDFTNYSRENLNVGIHSILSAKFGFSLRDKNNAYKNNTLLRLGISCNGDQNFIGYFYHTDKKSGDTLISTQTGKPIYVDSLHQSRYSILTKRRGVSIDAALIYKIRPENRVFVYFGAAITAGASMNQTLVADRESTSAKYVDPQHPDQYPGFQNYSYQSKNEEQFRNHVAFHSSIYIPVGINLKLGKTNKFWKKVNLFYELSPAITFNIIPELNPYFARTLNHQAGIRIARY